jgi:hypothetical protein
MTVRELIEKLQAFDPEMIVAFYDYDGHEYLDPDEIKECEVVRSRAPRVWMKPRDVVDLNPDRVERVVVIS